MAEPDLDVPVDMDVDSQTVALGLPPSMPGSHLPESPSGDSLPTSPSHHHQQHPWILSPSLAPPSLFAAPPPPSPLTVARTQFERYTLPPFESHTHVRVLDHFLSEFPPYSTRPDLELPLYLTRPDLNLHVSPHATALAINAGTAAEGVADAAADTENLDDSRDVGDATDALPSSPGLLPLPPTPAADRLPQHDLGPWLGRLPPEVLELVFIKHLDLDTLVRGVLLVNRAANSLVHHFHAYRAVHTHAFMTVRGMLALNAARFHTCYDLWRTMCEPRCGRCGDPMGGYVYLLTCSRSCLACLRFDGRFQPLTMRQAERMYALGTYGLSAATTPGKNAESLARHCQAKSNEMPWRYPVPKSLTSVIQRELRGGWPEPDLSVISETVGERQQQQQQQQQYRQRQLQKQNVAAASSSSSAAPLVWSLPHMRVPPRLYCAPSTPPEVLAALPTIHLVDHGAAYWAGVALQGGSQEKAVSRLWRPMAGVWDAARNATEGAGNGGDHYVLAEVATPPTAPPQVMPADFARFYGYQFLAVSRLPWLRLRGGGPDEEEDGMAMSGHVAAVEWGAGCRACWAEEENRMSPHHVLRLYTPELFAEHLTECGRIEGGVHVG